MNLGKQIQAYRKKMDLSQDNLAAKIYVSRQTISNWETGRSYPDVENLLLLSTLFGTSLDELVKGDVPQMKQKISQVKFDRDAHGMLLFFVLAMVMVGPAAFLPAPWWWLLPVIFWLVSLFFGFRIEKVKHEKNIQTYREIVAFMADQDLTKVRAKRNWVKDSLNKVVVMFIFAVVGGLIALISTLPYFLMH